MRSRLLPVLATALLASACMAPPPPPPLTPNPPGGTYKALGTEPFWGLTIDERQMIFTQPDAQPIAQPTPKVIVGFAGEIYQTPRLNVNIVHAQCSDGMSDRTYPDKVQVTVDGRQFSGCGGGTVAPGNLAGSNWRVVAINGRATPPAGDFTMRFEQDRVNAKFGCNSMGAEYDETGDALDLAPVMATRMACSDMSFETQGGAVLGQAMIMSWSGDDRLSLSNAAGRIDLERSN
jgi:heat shock protein HslJ